MNDLTCCSSKLDDMVRTYPTRTVLAAVGTGIVLGVLARLLHHHAKEPTSMEAAIDAVRGAGGRMRDLFR
jgi:hypothetical protein